MIEVLNKIALIVGYVVIAVGIGTFIRCGIDYNPVGGVLKLTFYDQGLVVVNKREIDPRLLHHLYELGYTIWDVHYPYALAPSYTNLVSKYQAWRADRRGENDE